MNSAYMLKNTQEKTVPSSLVLAITIFQTNSFVSLHLEGCLKYKILLHISWDVNLI